MSDVVTATQARKKWSNLVQKYKVSKCNSEVICNVKLRGVFSS